MSVRRQRRDSGQAVVETALTLPLTIFLILGTIQLFMAYQARLVAHYAVARATRAGSLNHGNCERMHQVAVAALLPTFSRTDSVDAYVASFKRHKRGRFDLIDDGGRNRESIVWIKRERPTPSQVRPNEEELFDMTNRPVASGSQVLEVRMTFWYPLRIPFANWVIAQTALAKFNIAPFRGWDPLNPSRRINWRNDDELSDSAIGDELRRRFRRSHYALPIEATYAMRMMTPARARYFRNQMCPKSY